MLVRIKARATFYVEVEASDRAVLEDALDKTVGDGDDVFDDKVMRHADVEAEIVEHLRGGSLILPEIDGKYKIDPKTLKVTYA